MSEPRQFAGLDANKALVEFMMSDGATLSDKAREKLTETIAGSNNLETLIVAVETLYADRASLNQAGAELLRDLAEFVSRHNFYGRGGQAGRATKIIGIADRIARGNVAEKAGDLEPDPRYSHYRPAPPESDAPVPDAIEPVA